MRITRGFMLAAAALAACSQDQDGSRNYPLSPSLDVSGAVAGQVYALTNQAAANTVLAFNRAADGTLTAAGVYPTGGTGTGAGLGSQSAITLDHAGSRLAAVNAGSNEVSLFRVNGDGSLHLTARVASGGVMPISVTISHDLLYVLNAGGSGNITGFRIAPDGALTGIPGSTRALTTSAADPAQVAFDPTGTTLVVTEKATNSITTFAVDANGVAHGPVVTPSSGQTPFGFGFTNSGTLIVSEAFGGAADGSAVSSYTGTNGAWTPVTASAFTTETSACWIVVTNNGRFAYTTNAASGSVSGYAIDQGALTLLDASGVTGNVGAGSSPGDMALSRDSRFLYTLARASHQVAAFAIGSDGSLTPLPGWISGLPAGAEGLAAR